MVDLKVNLAGLVLDNPIVPASGTFGYGEEFASLYDINILGSFSFKGTTAQERFGNPTPRIADCANGMLNSVGLQNPGVDYVCNTIMPKMKTYFNKPVVANIGGFSIEEYCECAKKVSECEQVGIVELNVSCPNVHGGGMGFGTDAKLVYDVTSAVKQNCKKPLFVKLTPNVTDIKSIAKACEDAGANGVTLINTMLGMRINLNTRKPILAMRAGGYSGKAVFPVAIRMINDVYNTIKLPIMGCGGVETAEDVIEMMLAGATAVQVGSANLINPFVCKEIIQDLPNVCKKYKINKLSDIIGGVNG